MKKIEKWKFSKGNNRETLDHERDASSKISKVPRFEKLDSGWENPIPKPPLAQGVKLSGSDDAHYFPSLAALINQHAHTPLTLPVKLNIPLYDRFTPLNPELSYQSETPRQENTISSSFYFLHESGKKIERNAYNQSPAIVIGDQFEIKFKNLWYFFFKNNGN